MYTAVWRDHVSREHSTAAVGFHFGGRPHKRNYCFVFTSLVLCGLHQRSGVALPTGGRADPAIGNEALAGTRRSVFLWGGDVALYFTYVPTWYHTVVACDNNSVLRTPLYPRLLARTRTNFFFGMHQLETRFARIKEKTNRKQKNKAKTEGRRVSNHGDGGSQEA